MDSLRPGSVDTSLRPVTTIFNQRENPAVHGGRESRPFRDATAASGTAGTPTETAKSFRKRVFR